VFESFARAIAQHPLRDYTSMKMVFIFPNLPDRINPMTALARSLQVRNQESVVAIFVEHQWFARRRNHQRERVSPRQYNQF
jgi:hypothetical protein